MVTGHRGGKHHLSVNQGLCSIFRIRRNNEVLHNISLEDLCCQQIVWKSLNSMSSRFLNSLVFYGSIKYLCLYQEDWLLQYYLFNIRSFKT